MRARECEGKLLRIDMAGFVLAKGEQQKAKGEI